MVRRTRKIAIWCALFATAAMIGQSIGRASVDCDSCSYGCYEVLQAGGDLGGELGVGCSHFVGTNAELLWMFTTATSSTTRVATEDMFERQICLECALYCDGPLCNSGYSEAVCQESGAGTQETKYVCGPTETGGGGNDGP